MAEKGWAKLKLHQKENPLDKVLPVFHEKAE